jgi:replication factor C subunit 2/4
MISAKEKATENTSYELPWYFVQSQCSLTCLHLNRVEKYRPTILDDIVGNAETIDRLKVIAKDGNCPHIIISVS